MKRTSVAVPLLVFVAAICPVTADTPPETPATGHGDGPGRSEDDGWVGKHRDEVIDKWGSPDRIKKQRDGQVLIFEREVLTGFAYGENETSRSYRVGKDDDGKRRLEEKPSGRGPQPVYRKVKFRFHLDDRGRVVRFQPPKVKDIDLSSLPQPSSD